MADREKVMTWLEICGENRDCSGTCPYSENGFGEYGQCREALMTDAFELLKWQGDALEQMRLDNEDLRKCYAELMKEQQPKTARWEKRTGMMPPEYHGHYWCSNCEWHGRYNECEADYKFCPACGAKMEKEFAWDKFPDTIC